MATQKQRTAARKNIKKATKAAKQQRTLAHLPKETRRDLGRNAAAARKRGGQPGRNLEDRTRTQLYQEAQQRGIPGRSRMGKSELVDALRQR